MIVTFCGHREGYNSEAVSDWLDTLLPMLIEGGADTFYLGGYGRFDELAAAAVWRQKAVYPGIRSVLIVPYPNRKHDSALYDDSMSDVVELYDDAGRRYFYCDRMTGSLTSWYSLKRVPASACPIPRRRP